ncbi:cytochrome P450 2G1-like [Lissotriton helveticus]
MEFGAAASLALAVFISCLLFINAWRKMFLRGNLPPGPTPLPLVGNLLQVKSSGLLAYLRSLYDVYGPVFTIYIGPRPVMVICGYDALKEAFIDQGDAFVSRGAAPAIERIFHDSGVTISNNERWKQLRKFSIMTLRDFGMGKRLLEDKITEEARCMVDLFRNTKEEFCEPLIGLHPAAANVIFSIILGDRFDYEDEKFRNVLKSLSDGLVILSSIWGQLYDIFPWIMYYLPGPHNRMFKMFLDFEDLLLDRIKSHQENLDCSSPQDFVDCYLIRKEQEKDNPCSEFSIKNLVPTIMDILLGGLDTVTNTMRHGILYLLKYPEVQGKIHEEIDRVIGQHRTPMYEDRNKMPYTNAVIHEILRVADNFPLGINHSVVSNTNFRGYTIPKGTDVMYLLSTVLKDRKYFNDPDNFNPERFLDENGAFKTINASVPFSIGKRNCLAEGLARMEIFMFLTTILQNFSLKSPLDPKDIDFTPREFGIANVAPVYKLSFVPRQGKQ